VRKQGSRTRYLDPSQASSSSQPNSSGALTSEVQVAIEQRLKDQSPDRCVEMEQALARRVQVAEYHVSQAESGLANVEAGLRAADASFAALRTLAQIAGFQLSERPNGDLDGRRFMSRPKFAAAMGVCIRLIDRQKTRMTKGVHYHYNGARLLFHNPEAVEFILATKKAEPPDGDLDQLAAEEVARRRNRRKRGKSSGGKSSEGSGK